MMRSPGVWRGLGVLAAAFCSVAIGLADEPVGAYPPNTEPAQERSLDVEGFAPVCVRNAPFIAYSIVTNGFESAGPATLRFFDANGQFIEERIVDNLSGRTIYPGATVSADGTALDWPGWILRDGEWVRDPSDEALRSGITIEVTVNPTATAAVVYPEDDSGCAGPLSPAGGGEPPANTDDTTAVLPSTGGSSPSTTLWIAGLLVLAGVVSAVAVRSRREVDASAPAPS